MSRFDRLLEEKHLLDRQLGSYMDSTREPLFSKLLAADTPEERGKILDEFDASLKPFREMYKSLGEATAKEFGRPWWKFW